MIKKLCSVLLLIMAATVLSGCDVVPPGYKGKILSRSGYSSDIKEAGKYKLWGSDELVLLETSTQTMSIPVTVKMADEMDLAFNVNFRTRIGGNEKILNAMFNDITSDEVEGHGKVISLRKVYNVYGNDVVGNVSRSVVSKYRVNQVNANYDNINKELQTKLREAMVGSPLEVSNVTVASISWPKVITDAIEKQQERELAIKTEQNQQDIEMVKRTNALALAQADREIELTKARTLKDSNEITAGGLSDKLIAYKALEVQETMAENKSAIFVPYEAFNAPGLSNRIFNTK